MSIFRVPSHIPFGRLPAPLPTNPPAGGGPVVGDANITQAAQTLTAFGGGEIGGAASITQAANTLSAAGAVAVAGAASLTQASETVSAAGSRGNKLRFFGTGSGNIDRARLPLDTGGTSTAIDVGAGDFCIEAWIQFDRANNTANISGGDARNSNIIWDRDIWNHARGWVVGLTRSGSSTFVCFGMAESGGGWATITGAVNVGDGAPHHVALTFQQSTRRITLYVDGTNDATRIYDQSNLSYPDGFDPGAGQNNPYLVLGSEKHDAGSQYPSYNGYMDELRISTVRRYTTAFTRPSAPFTVDGDTVGLYHMNDGAGTVLLDSASGVNGELLIGGANNGPQWVTVDLVPASIGAASLTQAAQTVQASGNQGVITGAASITQAAETVNAAGAVASVGAATVTQAAQSTTAAGTVPIVGAAALTQAAQTIEADGVDPVVGAASLTQAAQTVNASGGTPATLGDAVLTQDSQTVSGAALVFVSGAATLTQAAESVSGDGVVLVVGNLNISQAGNTVLASGGGPASGANVREPTRITLITVGRTGITLPTSGKTTVELP